MTPETDTFVERKAIKDEAGRIAKERTTLDVRELRCLRKIEQFEIWRDDGHPTIYAYLEQCWGLSPRVARERMRVSRAMETLPRTEEAFAGHALHYSGVRELTRVATPTTEDQWLLATVGKTLREIEQLVRGREPGDLPNDPPREDTTIKTVRFDVVPSTHALLLEARKRLQDESEQGLDDDGIMRAFCLRVLQPPPIDGPPAPAYQVAITVCTGCNRAWQGSAGSLVEIEPVALEQALCDAIHIGRIDSPVPTRARSEIPPATRRLVWHRDHARCVVPGCRSTRFLELHHILFRERGGSNDPSNLILCCSGHHRAIHEGHIHVSGTAPDNLVFKMQAKSAA